VQHDPTQAAGLTDQEKAMLAFVEKMTTASWTMTAQDVEQLRVVDFSDVQVLEIVQLTGWFNFMTRVADALGVEVEPWRESWHDELFSKRAAVPPRG